jgi:hypothetical protein
MGALGAGCYARISCHHSFGLRIRVVRVLFNDRILFLHVPKAAGSSVSSFLLRSLRGRIIFTEPARPLSAAGAPLGAQLGLAFRRMRHAVSIRLRPRLRRMDGTRHENLVEAAEVLARLGRNLGDFDMILAVIRNPYDLEVSRFHYLRAGHLGVPGIAHTTADRLARAGDFAAFAAHASYHGALPGRVERWFEIDGRMPANMRVLRFETLEPDLHRALAPYCRTLFPLPHQNASVHRPYAEYLTPEIEAAIFRKYRWLFEKGFYPREVIFPQ